MVTRRVFSPEERTAVAPPGFLGTYPEYVAHQELVRQGYLPGIDFSFQSKLLGGRSEIGGLVADFLFDNPPGLAININGVYEHYERNDGERGALDEVQRGQLASLSITLIFIDDTALLSNPGWYISQALSFIDHSELAL